MKKGVKIPRYLRVAIPNAGKAVKEYSRGLCLDACCGDGNYLPYFRCTRLLGVDVNLYALKVAKTFRNAKAEFVLCDVSRLPFKPNQFNFIWCGQVIEHFNEPEGRKLIEEFERVCDEEADIVIATTNFNKLYGFIQKKLLQSGERSWAWYHTFYDIKKIKKMGFEIVGYSITTEVGIRETFFRYAPLRIIGDFVASIFNPIAYFIIARKKVRKTRNISIKL